MISVLVFGAGGHARVVIDIIEKQGCYQVAGVLARDRSEAMFLGYPVLSGLEQTDVRRGVIAVGDNWTRARIARDILANHPDFEFVSVVHPSAQVARDVTVAAGTVVMAGVCINTATRIGAHCILNTRASIDHDNVFDDFSSAAPGTTTGGNVRVGGYAALGIGTVCLHCVAIGEHAVVGAGSLVCRDVPGHVVAYGTPCRVVRPRQPGDPYLQRH